MPVIRPAKAWPYASLQHSGRMRMQKTNQITGDNPPGRQQPSSRWLTQFASSFPVAFLLCQNVCKTAAASCAWPTPADLLGFYAKAILLSSTQAKIIACCLGDQPKSSSLVAPRTKFRWHVTVSSQIVKIIQVWLKLEINIRKAPICHTYIWWISSVFTIQAKKDSRFLFVQ